MSDIVDGLRLFKQDKGNYLYRLCSAEERELYDGLTEIVEVAADDIERLERELVEVRKLTSVWRCYACGHICHTEAEANHHFGKLGEEHTLPECLQESNRLLSWTKRRLEQSESQAAVMREALIETVPYVEAVFLSGADEESGRANIILDRCRAALSTDAGRKVMDVVEAARLFDRQCSKIHPLPISAELWDTYCGLQKALAAMGK